MEPKWRYRAVADENPQSAFRVPTKVKDGARLRMIWFGPEKSKS
jgi:hypothetical protein